jgi:phosphoenolpyruvate carboxykinase (GTP)
VGRDDEDRRRERIDWQGQSGRPTAAEGGAPERPLHRTAVAVPVDRRGWEDPEGVPISAFLFGGRPRVRGAARVPVGFNWDTACTCGATIGSETTAAPPVPWAVRRDPMSMLPFCGYHMGDYFNHWLQMGRQIIDPPRIFCVKLVPEGCARPLHLAGLTRRTCGCSSGSSCG